MTENKPPPQFTMRVRRHHQFDHHEPDDPAQPLPEKPIWELPWYGQLFFVTLPYSLIACIALFAALVYGIANGLAYVLRLISP